MVQNQLQRITKKQLDRGHTRKALLDLYLPYVSDKLQDLRHLSFRGLATLMYVDGERQSRSWKSQSFKRKHPHACKEIEKIFKQITEEQDREERERRTQNKLERMTGTENDNAWEMERKRRVKEEYERAKEFESRRRRELEIDFRRTNKSSSDEEERSLDNLPLLREKPLFSCNQKVDREVMPNKDVQYESLNTEPVRKENTSRPLTIGEGIASSVVSDSDIKIQGRGPYTIEELATQEFKVEVTVKIRPVRNSSKPSGIFKFNKIDQN